MNNGITIYNIQDVFFQMEEKENLFSLQMKDGTYYWDVVRIEVFYGLLARYGGPFTYPPSLPTPSLATKVKDLGKTCVNQITRRYLATHKPQYIFLSFQRIQQGSRIIDNITDHLYDLVSEDAIAVEFLNKASISYRDIICGRKTRIPQVAVRRSHNELDLHQVVNTISEVINKYFGITFDVYNLILNPILTYRENKNYYLKLFERWRPKAIVCPSNGTLKGMFSAAKMMRVPTLELQHGGSSSRTIHWSYPKAIQSNHSGLAVPTIYLTFSDYWNDNTHFPVKYSVSIGNDFFYQEPIAGDDNGVLIISSYMYHESLMNLVLELASYSQTIRIYYKLHPHQYDQKATVVNAFRNNNNIVVVAGEKGFPELFTLCNYVIGVHSTTLYIALQAGKKVCLFKRSNYFWHEDIYKYVEIFDTASELNFILNNPQNKFCNNSYRVPVFFQPFDTHKFKQVLDNIEQYEL